MTIRNLRHTFVFVLLLCVAMLFGCAIARLPSQPVVSIRSPAHGASVNLGQEVLVQAMAADANSIARVELWVDGVLITMSSPPSTQPSYAAVLHWTPTVGGTHMLIVKAINVGGMTSDPAAVTVNVVAQSVPPAPPTSIVAPPAPATAAQPPRAGDPYVDRVVSFTPGNPTASRFSDPKAVLGKPDFDEPTLSGFLTLGVGGSITIEFVDNIAVDGPGPDIEIYGDPYDDEMWIAEVSADCVNFKSFGMVRERVRLDLATVGLTFARCVRLTDDGNPAGGTSPGAELDAVVALNSAPPPTTAPGAAPTPFIPPTPTLISKPNEYITVAQLNLWFHGPGCYGGFEAYDCSGKGNINLTPALGATYDSASMEVIRQQIEWATAYGVDAFSIEWTTPRQVPGSIENILDDNFLKAPDLVKMRWCLFYDLVLRIQQTPGLKADLSRGMDFNNPDVYNTFVADIGRFATKYFSHRQYLKIDGRPVIYVWGTWNATGRYVEAFQAARQKAASLGYDVYLVGDVVLKDGFSSNLAAVYDADTNAWFFMPDSLPTSKDMGDAAIELDKILTQWEKRIAGLKVIGRKDEVVLQPGFTPQEDNRQYNQVNHDPSFIYVPALSKNQVTAVAQVVRKHAHPAGSQGLKLIWLNTWNNWPETTTFEPTAAQGPKYPAGNYQFDMLEVVREVFGAEIFSR